MKYSNKLRRNNKYLINEDTELFDTLSEFMVKIENNFHYSKKDEYINLAKYFLDNKIIVNDFSFCFITLYDTICEKVRRIKIEESVELANFLNKTDRCELGKLLAYIYDACDSFSSDSDVQVQIAVEKELKDYTPILLLTLQEE